MKRSLILCSPLTLVALLTACPSEGPSGDEADGTEGISSLGTDDDTTTTTATTTATTTFDEEETASDTADESTTEMNCGEVMIDPEYLPPNIMLIVDASGSMVVNSWDHDLDGGTPDVTRWNTLHGVVSTVMNNFGAQINAGIQRFPSSDACPMYVSPQNTNCYNSGACPVNDAPEVSVAPDNAVAIIGAIPGPDAVYPEVIGGTPATAGVKSALAHLKSLPPPNLNYMLLITDGAANCVEGLPFPQALETYDDGLQLTVGNAFTNDSIPTFVVGIDILDALVGMGSDGSPEANAYAELNEVAVAGGVPKNMGMDADKFFNTTNEQELLDALSSIIGEVTECTIDLTMQDGGPPTEDQIPYVKFTVNGTDVPFVENCDSESGWTWIVEGEIMTFCGSYCEDFKNGAPMEGTYGCPPPE